MTSAWITPELSQRFAGSLLHFLWQGVLIGLLAAVFLRLLGRGSAEARYNLSIAALLAMLAAPMVTFVFYVETGALTLMALRWMASASDLGSPLAAASGAGVWPQRILAIWFLGVTVFLSRLLIGWRISRGLVRSALDLAPTEVLEAFDAIRATLRVQAPARLLLQMRVDSPMVVGWLRPVVLLPMSLVSGLSEAQLIAVLAHELAHIRRHDFLVNILQRSVEALFFYHPAVWWLSKRARAEREHCCDDIAVAVCGSRKAYAEALIQMEHARVAKRALAVAATDGMLLRRFRRVLGLQTSAGEWPPAAAVMVLVLAACLVILGQSRPVEAVSSVAAPQPVRERVLPGPEAGPSLLGEIAAIVTAQRRTEAESKLATIEGVVLAAGTTEGLAKVNVELSQTEAVVGAAIEMPRSLVTEADGKFSFKDLPPGAYRLFADVVGGTFYPGEYGQKNPRGRGAVIRLAEGQELRNLQIGLIRTAAISGRVTDERGEPVGRVRVEAMELTYRDGQRVANIMQAVQTDDLGRYRMFWLNPGRYYVGARVEDTTRKTVALNVTPPGRVETYEEISAPIVRQRSTADGEFDETFRMVYFGNTVDLVQSTGIDLAAGGSRDGINISLQPGVVRALRIRGVVFGANGQPVQGAVLRLIPAALSPNAVIPNATSARQGAFELQGVVPGSYLLYAASAGANGRLAINVGSNDLENVQVRIGAGNEVRGKVSIEGGLHGLELTRLSITLTRSPELLGLPPSMPGSGVRGAGPAPNGRVGPDGSFALQRVSAGDYKIAVQGLPKGAYLKSARMDQEDVQRIAVDTAGLPALYLVIGTETGKVRGATRDTQGEAVANAKVVLAPKARSNRGLYMTVSSDNLGRFEWSNVPAGDYRMFSWEYVTEGAWLNDDFMKSVESRGQDVLVMAGKETNIDSVPLPAP